MREADESAYCDFVAARRRSLLQTAFLLTGDWHQAEDLVQITLAKLYVTWTRIRRRDDVDAYARRTLLNAYLDERRRPWRREHAVETVPDRAGAAAAEPPDPKNEAPDPHRACPDPGSPAGGASAAVLGGPIGGSGCRPPALQCGNSQEPDRTRARAPARDARPHSAR